MMTAVYKADDARMKLPCSTCGKYRWVSLAIDPETQFMSIPDVHCGPDCEVEHAAKLLKRDTDG
jgi:rubredoxin